ncbi:unnamed protein product, partial [Tilletia caries]
MRTTTSCAAVIWSTSIPAATINNAAPCTRIVPVAATVASIVHTCARTIFTSPATVRITSRKALTISTSATGNGNERIISATAISTAPPCARIISASAIVRHSRLSCACIISGAAINLAPPCSRIAHVTAVIITARY